MQVHIVTAIDGANCPTILGVFPTKEEAEAAIPGLMEGTQLDHPVVEMREMNYPGRFASLAICDTKGKTLDYIEDALPEVVAVGDRIHLSRGVFEVKSRHWKADVYGVLWLQVSAHIVGLPD